MHKQKGKKTHLIVHPSHPKKGENKEGTNTLEKHVPECFSSEPQHFMHGCLQKHFFKVNSVACGGAKSSKELEKCLLIRTKKT